MSSRLQRLRKTAGGLILVVMLLYVVLLIPGSDPPLPDLPDHQPFVWNQDENWSALEAEFQRAAQTDSALLSVQIDSGLNRIQELLTPFYRDTISPQSPLLAMLESEVFALAPKLAVRPSRLQEYMNLHSLIRRTVKDQSRRWDMNTVEARQAVYRLLYGGRTAIEEILLQLPMDTVASLVIADQEPSQTPSAEILGVQVHSGDLLVSRGGAPTSALIARGSDYPGNFSHVALVHVDEVTGEVSIIEAHIEVGVAVASVEQYLADKKLRIMVLRLRSDHPALVADPMLPHKAAELALRRAEREHIPYDFEMDSEDHSKLFCSEVASAPYADLGVNLWMGVSTISSEGLASWLAAFGVTHFETQEPSDLEYDPQLRVVAEWRDPETLWKDHVDNAVLDAMLEGAEKGDRLDYDPFMLPVGRVMKAWCRLLNGIGEAGAIPEGMSAAAALRNDRFSQRHARLKDRVEALAGEFIAERGYRPPYWQLVSLAREAIATESERQS